MVEEIRNEQASVFNMALAYLQRMDNLLTLCSVSSINRDYNTWFFALYNLLKELSPKMDVDKKEREVFAKRLDEAYPLIRDYSSIKAKGGMPSKQSGGIFPMLSNIEMDLRAKMNELNLLMPRASDPRFALTGR